MTNTHKIFRHSLFTAASLGALAMAAPAHAGPNAECEESAGLECGTGSSIRRSDATAIGISANASGSFATAVGSTAIASGNDTVAVGYGADAMTDAPFPSAPGKTGYAANGAVVRGQFAISATISHRLDVGSPFALTAGFSQAGGKNTAARVGVAGEF